MGGGVSIGDELVARLFDPETKLWTGFPHGIACKCIEAFEWPESARSLEGLGEIRCQARTAGGFNEYDIEDQRISVESLVLACDWILTRHSSGLTVRGAPVTKGSPLAVATQTSSSAVFLAGSVLELSLEDPALYKRGKGKISVLLIGFYCSKAKFDKPGAIYHVSEPTYSLKFQTWFQAIFLAGWSRVPALKSDEWLPHA